jgi:hypothetical protein
MTDCIGLFALRHILSRVQGSSPLPALLMVIVVSEIRVSKKKKKTRERLLGTQDRCPLSFLQIHECSLAC